MRFSPHSHIACCATHLCTSLCSDIRETVSLCLSGFDFWIQQCWTEFKSSVCPFTLKPISVVFDLEHCPCILCLYVCVRICLLNQSCWTVPILICNLHLHLWHFIACMAFYTCVYSSLALWNKYIHIYMLQQHTLLNTSLQYCLVSNAIKSSSVLR